MSKINSATKRMLALLLAMTLIFSGVAITSNASGENEQETVVTRNPDLTNIVDDNISTTPTVPSTIPTTVPTTVPAPTVLVPTIVSKSDADRTITVKLPTVNGYKVQILAEPSASYTDLNNGTWLFLNLTPGQKYTFKAYIIFNGAPVYSSGSVEATIKDKYPTPNAPVASKVTSTSITAVKVSGCEYRLTYENGNVVKTYNWSDNVLFEKLTAETIYVLSIRKKGDANKYASDPRSITVKTLKTGKAEAVGTPVLVDKTDKTITVKCAEGDEKKNIEFSIDKGKTWQHSGEFKNLTPDTIYGIIAREVYDPAVQDPNPSSGILERRTNTKARFEASLSKCTFKLAEGKVYANELIGVTVTGDAPSDLYRVEYGDTRLVPDYVLIDGRKYYIEGTKGEILPGEDNANKKIQISVVYKKERYIGGNAWEKVGEVSSKQEIEVGPNRDIFVIIGEFFTSIANVLLNTIPELILGTGEYWEKGLALLFGMFGDLGGK